jgi:LPXTG-site transpeptidase (sortase) family protein
MKFVTINNSVRTLAVIFVIAGLALIAPITYYWLRDRGAVVQAASTVPVHPAHLKPSVNLVTGQPVEIAIPSLSMDLQVIPGVYNPNSGEWTLTDNDAQFAEPSVPPNNETGNTLIYGHYRPSVFAYLHHIQPGAQAIITTANGYKFTYTYQNTQAFNPNDTSIFTYQGVPRLTIQTCSGTFMQNRQMYYFQYDGYSQVS